MALRKELFFSLCLNYLEGFSTNASLAGPWSFLAGRQWRKHTAWHRSHSGCIIFWISAFGVAWFLDDMEINTLAQARNTLPKSSHYWYNAEDICISGTWKSAWDSFTNALDLGGICLYTRADSLIWAFNKQNGFVTTNLVYESIVLSSNPPMGSRLLDLIWNDTMPRKICCFIWRALMNKLLT